MSRDGMIFLVIVAETLTAVFSPFSLTCRTRKLKCTFPSTFDDFLHTHTHTPALLLLYFGLIFGKY